MGIINNRRFDTGTSFHRGFPLLPADTSLGIPQQLTSIGVGQLTRLSRPLFSIESQLGWLRLSGSFTYMSVTGLFFGYQMGYDVEGQTFPSGLANLRFSNEYAQGGFGFGIGATLSFSFRLDESFLEFSFRDGITSSWRALLTQTLSATFDLIQLAIIGLAKLTQTPALQELTELRAIAGSGAVWGLFANNTSRGFTSGSHLEFRPRLNLSVNILEKIPKVREAIKAMKKAGFALKAGPTLVISFPVRIRIARLTTEDGAYNPVGTSGGAFLFQGPPAPNTPVSSVQITHSHTISIAWGLEIRASFTLFKVLSQSAVIRIPLNLGANITDLEAALGPYFTAFTEDDVVASAPEMPEMPQVIWG